MSLNLEDYAYDFPEIPSISELNDKRKKIPAHIALAIRFGLVKPGYTLQDYFVEAVTGPPELKGKAGYETALIWAVQGSGKSSRGLQYLKWLYGSWEDVLNNIVFRPQDFINHLEKVPDDHTIPAIFWDDIMVHFPASKFKTDLKQYEAVDSTFASIRTKVNVILASLPIIDRCAKNVKDNATVEVFIGRNQLEAVYRLFRLPGIRKIESNFFKAKLQEYQTFSLFDVPIDIWRRYWVRRIALTNEALQSLKSTTDMGEDPGLIPVLVACQLYTEGTNKKISANTLQQMGSRGILKSKKVKGRLCIDRVDLNDLILNDLKKRGSQSTV